MNENTPKISVIIPTYNQAIYLGAAIQSVLAQTYSDYEVIVIDDGSNDDTETVIKQFGTLVHYFRQENQGLAGARNTGIRRARGSLIAMLDSDDLWLPKFLEKMMGLVTQHPEAVVYYCSARCIDTEGRELHQVLGAPVGNPDNLYQVLLRANYLIPSTIIMRYSIVVDAGLFDVGFRRLQDWELWIRLMKASHQFCGLTDVLVNYRIHNCNLSTDPLGGQSAAMALAIKHFGQDDGKFKSWSADKRRAYGGVYRYNLLTSVQRQNDWQAGAQYMRQALQIDPTLATDLDLFHDLAWGSLLVGLRVTLDKSQLENNAFKITCMLDKVFKLPFTEAQKSLRRITYGTAYFMLGLVAYNSQQLSLSKHFLSKALYFRPDLIRESRITGNLVKSLLGSRLLEKIKRVKKPAT